MIALEKSAEANERAGDDWHAGKHLEACAQLAKDVGTPADIAAYAERACAAYCNAGRSQTGAEALSRCARLIDERDPGRKEPTCPNLSHARPPRAGHRGKSVSFSRALSSRGGRRRCPLLAELSSVTTRATTHDDDALTTTSDLTERGRRRATIAALRRDAAANLYLRACEMLEDEDKHIYTVDHYRAAGAVQMRAEKFAAAAETMVKFGAACDTSGSKQSQCKAYLSAVVALLYAGDAVDAQATYADCSEIHNFGGSEEQRTAYALLSAYRDADADAIQAAVAKSASVGFLEAPFARAAKKLPRPGQDLKEMSIKMGGSGGVMTGGEGFLEGVKGGVAEEDEDDLT